MHISSIDVLQSSGDEVVFLGNDVDTSFDIISDMLVYSPVHVDCVGDKMFVETTTETVPFNSNPDVFLGNFSYVIKDAEETVAEVPEDSQEPAKKCNSLKTQEMQLKVKPL